MFVVDTNVLVYSADEGSPHHNRCLEHLNAWRLQAGAWYLTWAIIYEFLRVVTHARVMRRPWDANHAWEFISMLLESPGLDVLVATERHASVAAQVFANSPQISGNLMHDAHTAVLMLEHGVRRIYTRDTDFHRFPFLEPLDPLA
jgi:toxin-antitoxin system PIN domain toxin